jgi:hypothetical protein
VVDYFQGHAGMLVLEIGNLQISPNTAIFNKVYFIGILLLVSLLLVTFRPVWARKKKAT